jgi:hypothetical protein
MHSVWDTIGVFLLGGIGWLVASFVGRPVRHFVDLRGEVIQRSVLYGNVAALKQESPNGSIKQIDLSDEEIKRLREAEGVFRDLAARMRAFALNERVAVWLVNCGTIRGKQAKRFLGYPTHCTNTEAPARKHGRRSNARWGSVSAGERGLCTVREAAKILFDFQTAYIPRTLA